MCRETPDGIALDKYTFVRDAYLVRRRNQVYDGDPPDEPAAVFHANRVVACSEAARATG